MSRLFILFFALLLPLQFAWAGAASYCQHETNPAQTKHFGHHQHMHKAGAEKTAGSQLLTDTDCGVCHATGAPMMVEAPAFKGPQLMLVDSPPADTRPVPSALARVPYRPQWSRLA